jgi:hypothetical protein
MNIPNLTIRTHPIGHANRIIYPDIELSEVFITKPEILDEAF